MRELRLVCEQWVEVAASEENGFGRYVHSIHLRMLIPSPTYHYYLLTLLHECSSMRLDVELWSSGTSSFVRYWSAHAAITDIRFGFLPG